MVQNNLTTPYTAEGRHDEKLKEIEVEDREFLMWLHFRLEHVHGESSCVDYMHKLRAIIKGTPKDKRTPNVGTGNSLNELKQVLLDTDS